MSNVSEDGNHTSNQRVYCEKGPYELHELLLSLSLNSIISITAFLGNILILVALRKVTSLHPPSKLLLGCLATTDLCTAFILHPLHITFLMSSEYSIQCYYIVILCFSVGGIFAGISLLTLTAISVDRLLALTLGVRYRHVVTARRVSFILVVFWLFSIFSSVMFLYNRSITLTIYCIGMLLCIGTSTFSYIKIYLRLRNHKTQIQDYIHQEQPNGGGGRGGGGGGGGGGGRGGVPLNIARYRKTVSNALCVQIALLVCYTPFFVVMTLRSITGLGNSSVLIAQDVTYSVVVFNSCLNPFLYCWRIREVRQAVKETVRQFCCFSN